MVCHIPSLAGGWTNPIRKICSSNLDHFPQVGRGKNDKNIWSFHPAIIYQGFYVKSQVFGRLGIFSLNHPTGHVYDTSLSSQTVPRLGELVQCLELVFRDCFNDKFTRLVYHNIPDSSYSFHFCPKPTLGMDIRNPSEREVRKIIFKNMPFLGRYVSSLEGNILKIGYNKLS